MENSVHYPSTKQLIDAATVGSIVSGNGRMILKCLANEKETYAHNLLFSSELLFFDILKVDFRRNLFAQAERLNRQIEFICYTRDFFEFSFSGWGQYIKREQGTLNYVDFMLAHNPIRYSLNGENFTVLRELLDLCNAEGFGIKVFNYDRHKGNIHKHFLNKCLGIFDAPNFDRRKRHNRSLTASEYEIQRMFNMYYSSNSSRFISDVLVQNIPDIKKDVPQFSKIEYDAIFDKYKDVVLSANELISEGEQILITDFEDLQENSSRFPLDVFCFNREQLENIVRSISSEIETPYPSIFSAKKLIKQRIRSKVTNLLRKFG